METMTTLEECILLAHRINKLGGCIFVYDSPHVDWVRFQMASSKIGFGNKIWEEVWYYEGNEKELLDLKSKLTNLLKEYKRKNELCDLF